MAKKDWKFAPNPWEKCPHCRSVQWKGHWKCKNCSLIYYYPWWAKLFKLYGYKSK